MARPNRRLARYTTYVDGPDPLAPPVDLAEALDAIGEDVMAGSSPEHALREFLRRGGRDQNGLDELARDVDLDEGDRALAQLQLDSLPPSPAAAVRELTGYDWRSGAARQEFEKIADLLGREVLDQRFAGMKQALENASDADRAALSEMLTDLNGLLRDRRRGADTPQQFDEFMARHGQHFPEQPRTLDELLDALAARAAAAQRMRNSMTREQREELDALAQQAFGSSEVMAELGQLDDSLRSLRPGEDWGGAEQMDGANGLGLGDGTGVFQDLADLDALAEQLAQSYQGSELDDVDLEKLARQLGADAVVDARTLQRLEAALRRSGTLRRGSDGNLALTPKAMRQLGRSVLRAVADTMSGRTGGHDVRRSGAAGEPSGSTREWAFGDTEPWDVTRTITNALVRRSGQRGPVRILVDDVEVQETEARTQACVALLVDTSFSMAMEGRWVPMKRTALALHTLITSRFRGDDLQLIGFGRSASVMAIEQLVGLDAQWEKGTNLHHALLLANRHFRKHPDAQPVLLIVTDGEPTSHLEPDGAVVFAYPPNPVTIALAVRELDGSTRLGARTTFFRLGDDPGLARFVDAMARRAGGTVVAPEGDDLGAAVLGSYLSSRRNGAFGGWGRDEVG